MNLDLKSLLSFYSKQSVDCSFVEVILRSIPAGVIFVEKENQKIVYVNDRFVQITGYNPMGLSFKHYALEVAKTRMMDRGPYAFDQLPLTKALLYGKAVYDQELIIYRQDNSEVAIISNAAPILDDKGQVMGAFSILSDNSECKKAADALKRSEENYRHLLRYAPAAIFQIYYQTPSFLSVNDAMTTLTGYDKEELLSLNPYTLLEPESVERLKDRIRRGLAGENIEGPVEYKVITKDGRHLWTILYVKPFYREGKLNNALVVAYDITERKNSEEALKKSEAKLRIQERTLSLIYNNVSEILYSLAIEPNNTYRFTSVNQPFLDATGLKENEIVGKTVNEVIPEPSLSLVLEKYNQAIKEKQTIRWDETTVYPAGEKIGEVTVAPIFDSEDRPLYIIGNVHDITERKNLSKS